MNCGKRLLNILPGKRYERVKSSVNLRDIINELQCFGVRIDHPAGGRKGGAGPAEGQTIIVQGVPVNCPVGSGFVRGSPYSIQPKGDGNVLKKHEDEIAEVTFPLPPKFYQRKTEEGIPYSHIALLHGVDCLASTVFQRCYNWENSRCGFCGIELSLLSGKTVPVKYPGHLSEVAYAALKEDGIAHITLTTGAQDDEDFAFSHLASCVRAIKERTGIPVHLQFLPPQDFNLLHLLKEAGVDTIGIHVETFDRKILDDVCPAKAEIGLKRFEECWKIAVTLFGRNQVSSFVIVGLGEERDSIIEGSEMLCEIGVYPYLLPLRPIPGTIFASSLPPHPDYLSSVYQEVADLLARYQLSWKRVTAGCVRCSSCSAITHFEHN